MDPIQTNNGYCGSGKTFDEITVACGRIPENEKTCIAVPSRKLARQVAHDALKRFADLRGRITKIVGGHHNDASAISRITQFLQTRDGRGELLIITHAALQMTSHWRNKDKWHLVVDEEISSECHVPVRLRRPETRTALIDLFRLIPYDDTYSILEAVDHGKIQDIRDHLYDDDIDEKFAPLTMRLLPDSSWTLFVKTAAFEEFSSGSSNRFDVHGLLHPALLDGFQSVKVLAANIDDSLMVKYWRKMGRNLLKLTPKQPVPVGDRLIIKYLPVPKWSKMLRDKVVDKETGTTVGAMYVQLCLEEANRHDPTGKHMFITNLDNEDIEFSGSQLSNVPHGMNDMQDHTVCAVFSALNAQPPHMAFLKHMLGISEREIRRAKITQTVYQSAWRGVLRNAKSDAKFLLLVPDQAIAEDTSENPHCKGCHVEPLVTPHPLPAMNPVAGRPSSYQTEEERQEAKREQAARRKRRERWRKKMSREILEGISVLRDNLPPNTTPPPDDQSSAGWWGSNWDSRATYWRPSEIGDIEYHRGFISQRHYSTTEFVEYLRRCSRDTFATKKHNSLICPSAFNLARDTDHGHSYSNIIGCQGVILDLDHTDATPNEIASAMAPFECIVYSSWSHTDDDRSYRACIPTTTPMTIDALRAILHMARQRFRDNGFVDPGRPGRSHGIDQQALNAARLYYLPCSRPNGVFEHYRPGGEAIDPRVWIMQCPDEIIDKLTHEPAARLPVPRLEPTSLVSVTGDDGTQYKCPQERTACEGWRRDAPIQGLGRSQFYHLFKWLQEIGYDDAEIRRVLTREAAYAHNPQERQSEIEKLLA